MMSVKYGRDVVELTDNRLSIQERIKEKIKTIQTDESSFAMGDLSDIIRKHQIWKKCLPRIEPFYAVKVNDLFPVLQLLVDIGLSFDCASKVEIQSILNFGVHPSRIIYANTFKQTSFIQYAKENNVSLMTFDCESELKKIAAIYPEARLVLRIKPQSVHNQKARFPLGRKFGCPMNEVENILQSAKILGMNIVGVSFHIGSECNDVNAYNEAIQKSRQVFDTASKLGFELDLLDIGGGFPGNQVPNAEVQIAFETSVSPVDQLATHVTGVLAHGQNKFFTFLDWNQYPHDSNLTMNIILAILYEISKLMGNKLPPILYLQADNCWRENKNRFVLAFCELLIHQRIFNEVHLSFLPVGHTHEDVDAAFSRIAEKLRKHDAETLPRLKELLPNIQEIEYIYGIRQWLTPLTNDIRKHTGPLHYKFSKDKTSNAVKLEYKQFHNSHWKTQENSMFGTSNRNIYNLPKGCPKIVEPQFEKINLERIKTRLPHWQCLFSDQMMQSEKTWWTQFLSHLENIKNNRQYMKQKVISKAKWLLPLLPRQTDQPVTVDHSHDVPPNIQRMLENDRQESEIADVIKSAIDKYFPGDNVRIIAEPGRFYVASAFTLAANIITKKILPSYNDEAKEKSERMYYINEGVCGVLMAALVDQGCYVPSHFQNKDVKTYSSTVWGPTCGSLDLVIDNFRLPELDSGDWVYFRDVGAYSFPLVSDFNSMPKAKVFYFCEQSLWKTVYSE